MLHWSHVEIPDSNRSSVNNDFHKTHDIFDLFDGLEVDNLDAEVPDAKADGETTNGANQPAPAENSAAN